MVLCFLIFRSKAGRGSRRLDPSLLLGRARAGTYIPLPCGELPAYGRIRGKCPGHTRRICILLWRGPLCGVGLLFRIEYRRGMSREENR
jgi:hypothetical protein